MDKNEILEKSRKDNQLRDEGVLHAQEKGRKWGVVGFLSLLIAVQIYQLVLGLDTNLPQAFFMGYISCEALGEYGFRRKKSYLGLGIVAALACVLNLAVYIKHTLPKGGKQNGKTGDSGEEPEGKSAL